MKGNFCTSPRSLSVITRGNARETVSGHVRCGDMYLSTFNGLSNMQAECTLKCTRDHTHRDNPGVAERTPFVTLKDTTTSQNIELGAQRLVRAYKGRRPRAAEMGSMIKLDGCRGF
jgi:hypothetical protein